MDSEEEQKKDAERRAHPYFKYAYSLPCGEWKPHEIRGLWNTAIEAAAQVVLDGDCSCAMSCQCEFVAEDIRKLRVDDE